MQVADHRSPDPTQVAVDPADQAVDLVTQDPVLLDLLPRGHRDLHEDGVLDVEVAVADELGEGAQAGHDALGVVEAVDAEEDLARVAQLGADGLGALGDGLGARQVLEALGVDRDRERLGPHGTPVGQVHEVLVGLVADPLAHEAYEVLRAAGQLEAEQVGAE